MSENKKVEVKKGSEKPTLEISEGGKGIPIECHNCGHVWNYTGSKIETTPCPSCMYKVNIQKQRLDGKKKPDLKRVIDSLEIGQDLILTVQGDTDIKIQKDKVRIEEWSFDDELLKALEEGDILYWLRPVEKSPLEPFVGTCLPEDQLKDILSKAETEGEEGYVELANYFFKSRENVKRKIEEGSLEANPSIVDILKELNPFSRKGVPKIEEFDQGGK